MKWEHLTVCVSDDKLKELMDKGWELVSSHIEHIQETKEVKICRLKRLLQEAIIL